MIKLPGIRSAFDNWVASNQGGKVTRVLSTNAAIGPHKHISSRFIDIFCYTGCP